MLIPTVGRIIHLVPSRDQDEAMDHNAPCRAALVTGVQHKPEVVIYVAAFSYRGDQTAVAITDPDTWHDPRECAR